MEGPFFVFCNIVILISSTIAAVCTTINLIKKPALKYKAKQETELNERIIAVLKGVLPELLKAHDIETRNKYRADREKYLLDIKDEILKDIRDSLSQIQILTAQCETLKLQYDTLNISAKDVLREKIVKIYNDNRLKKTFSTLDKERLDQFYKDYKALKGNSYIDKYYNRMKRWTVLDDDYEDEVEII